MNPTWRKQVPDSVFSNKAAHLPSVNWWLRLTSSGYNLPQDTLARREQTRRSQLAAWILLGLLVGDVVLLPIGLEDPGTFSAILVVGIGLVGAAMLNRRGFVTWAGILIVSLICGGDLCALLSESGGLTLDTLPAYDLLVIAVIVSASVLPQKSAFMVATINVGLICLDFCLQPHAADLRQELLSYPSIASGTLALLVRPITLQIVLSTVAYLWVRGMKTALARADRAEEIATLEHAIAEQRRQLEGGVQEILDVLVRVANGHPSTRVPLKEDHLLWRIASALNNLISRFERGSWAEQENQRIRYEIQRLAAALEEAQAGKTPIWPAPTGSPVDLLIERINGGKRILHSPTDQLGKSWTLSAHPLAKKHTLEASRAPEAIQPAAGPPPPDRDEHRKPLLK